MLPSESCVAVAGMVLAVKYHPSARPCSERDRFASVFIRTDSQIQAEYTFCESAQSEEKIGINMWQKKCPVCQQPMAKKLPTETVACTCGKYVWKG
jgi:hypothetical protein